MLKKIIYIFIFFILSISNIYANNIKQDNTINVIAIIKDDKWTNFNYLNVLIEKDNKTICEWITQQTFENIKLEDWKLSNLMKVKDNWMADFNCSTNELLLWDKLNPNIKVIIRSDGFFDLSNNQIVLSVKNLNLVDNKIIIWNYKQANFQILLTNIGNQYANTYDNNIQTIKDKLLAEEKRNDDLKNELLNTKEIELIINNIPKDIKEIPYNFVWTDYIYKVWGKNNLFISNNKVPDLILWKWNTILSWLIAKDNKLIVEYKDNFIEKEILLTIDIIDIPEFSIDIPIKIDDFNIIYKKWFSYKLLNNQIKNWINLSIWNKIYKTLKLWKNEKITLKYSEVVDKVETTKKENFNNNYLVIELDNKYLDPLWRFSYISELENWWIENNTIENNKILKNKDKFIIKEFIWINDIIPNKIIINGEKIDLKKISLNYIDFINQRLK